MKSIWGFYWPESGSVFIILWIHIAEKNALAGGFDGAPEVRRRGRQHNGRAHAGGIPQCPRRSEDFDLQDSVLLETPIRASYPSPDVLVNDGFFL